MGYIYKITNLINGKQYIGKTTLSVTKRFQEHCYEYSKQRVEKRPLYAAMLKYGIDNFVVEELLECPQEELSSYETLFIEKFDTYNNGYNATKGGDGTILFDYAEIIATFKKVGTITQTAALMKCSIDTVRKVLKLNNIEYYCNTAPKKVVRLDRNTLQELQEYKSLSEAARWLVDNGYAKPSNSIISRIKKCIEDSAKYSYKFKWKFK